MKDLWQRLIKQKNPPSRETLSREFGISDRAAGNLLWALKNKNMITPSVEADLEIQRLKSKLKEESGRNRDLILKCLEIEKQNDFLLGLREEVNQGLEIKASPSLKSEATALTLLSDVHVESRVEPAVVYGFNEYNPDIAKGRLENYARNLLTLVRKERQALPVKNLVAGFLGDFITGYIHEELRETNYMTPTEATVYIRDILVNILKYWSEYGEFENIKVVCVKGNHGRTTLKKHFTNAYRQSYEWMMYNDIKRVFDLIPGYDNIEFDIPKSEAAYIRVYDKDLRFAHGDQIKYHGGIGGIGVPLYKWLHRMDQQIHADMSYIGHYHNLHWPVGNCWVNGSVIGSDSYSIGMGFPPERPKQLFQLIDKKRGFTVSTMTICDG